MSDYEPFTAKFDFLRERGWAMEVLVQRTVEQHLVDPSRSRIAQAARTQAGILYGAGDGDRGSEGGEMKQQRKFKIGDRIWTFDENRRVYSSGGHGPIYLAGGARVKPLAVDLFCGKGGWTNGLQAVGWRVVGFDIATDVTLGYPGELVLQDVSTISGVPWRGRVGLIVASPPCQAYSYRAMPWKRAKALPPPDNSLFEHCFRIAREAECPIVVENVRGAQKWVGRAVTHYGSYYLWGDVPALIPIPKRARKFNPDGTDHGQGSWFAIADSKNRGGRKVAMNFHEHEKTGKPGRSFQSAAVAECGVKVPGLANGKFPGGGLAQGYLDGIKQHGFGAEWFDQGIAKHSSRSNARREASALIAMIPFDLARWIGQCYLPEAHHG